jgi:hypothetical protein
MTVASLDGDQRIERLAAARGMIMPAPAAVGFLSAHSGTLVPRAIANIHPPNAPAFLSLLSAGNGSAAVASPQQTSPGSPASTGSAGSTGSPASTGSPTSTLALPAGSTQSQSSVASGAATATPTGG